MNRNTRPSAIALVMLCTVLTASSKFFLKVASNQEHTIALAELFRNYWIFVAYVCYGISLILLILALRRGQLSTLYPFLAFSYFWVSLLSPVFFPTDSYSSLKFIGVGIIVGGLALISLEKKE
jgi:multidrug transporter EmrE-like cation transporter